jgi:NTP pyrophosphatase (non-canonical NTP hydrolase)
MINFSEYQVQAQETNLHRGGDPVSFYLHGMVGEIGTLTAEYKKRLRDGASHLRFQEKMAEEIGDLLWYTTSLATELGLDLGDIAAQNLTKCQERWGGTSTGPHALDSDAPPEQRLPRQFTVEFHDDGQRVRILDDDGRQVGATLNDNAHTDDGYRFHDVFHLANAAVLGWSPVVRSLMGRKRKYDEEVDSAEDGARAIFTEEGIVATLFRHAEQHDLFADIEHVDSELLRSVQISVTGLEVSVRSLSEWESAILQGYAAFRTLRESGGGTVRCDLDTGTIIASAPTVES